MSDQTPDQAMIAAGWAAKPDGEFTLYSKAIADLTATVEVMGTEPFPWQYHLRRPGQSLVIAGGGCYATPLEAADAAEYQAPRFGEPE